MMTYTIMVLSLFLIFYVGLNKPILSSIALSAAVSFLLLTFVPVQNVKVIKKQTEGVWI